MLLRAHEGNCAAGITHAQQFGIRIIKKAEIPKSAKRTRPA